MGGAQDLAAQLRSVQRRLISREMWDKALLGQALHLAHMLRSEKRILDQDFTLLLNRVYIHYARYGVANRSYLISKA